MATPSSAPLSRKQLVDLYYLEMRAKLLDIAAFLDRTDRARDAATAAGDFRLEAMRRAAGELLSGQPDRTARVQMCLSDPTSEPIPDASGLKGASGAYSPACYVPIREGGR
jgi:hypothetical protein